MGRAGGAAAATHDTTCAESLGRLGAVHYHAQGGEEPVHATLYSNLFVLDLE